MEFYLSIVVEICHSQFLLDKSSVNLFYQMTFDTLSL